MSKDLIDELDESCTQRQLEIYRLQARVKELEEALAWYAEQVSNCSRISGDGDTARTRLTGDLGNRARAALKGEQ